MIKRLKWKFVLINMTIVTVMLAVIFTLVLLFMGGGMQMQNERIMQQLIDRTERPGHPEQGPPPPRSPHFEVRLDENGNVIQVEHSEFLEMDEKTLIACVEEVLAQEKPAGLLPEVQLRFHRIRSPQGQIIFFMDISGNLNTMKDLTRVCIVISAVSFLVFLVISIVLAKWAVNPVEKAWQQQRQFVADASHELKTPLTVIMTNAELLQSPGYEEPEKQHFAENIMTMSRQMRGLVESLLELARLDSGNARMSFAEVDFSALTADALLPFEPIFFEKDLLLESELEEGIRVRGSTQHLQQVLDILLDNAAKYSSEKGQVRVRLKRQGNQCLLTVSNSGEAISREDLKNVFKRFYRIDKARSMNHSYGLGLAIAQNIVGEHGGRIWAESSGGTNRFCIQLPAIKNIESCEHIC